MNALICGQDNYIVIVCYQSILIERKTFTVTTSSSNSSRFRVCCLSGVTKDLQYGKPSLSLNIFPNLIGISNNFRLYPMYLVNCYETKQKIKEIFSGSTLRLSPTRQNQNNDLLPQETCTLYSSFSNSALRV